eukprot:3815214-Prorocentrum_lima.AAC.1
MKANFLQAVKEQAAVKQTASNTLQHGWRRRAGLEAYRTEADEATLIPTESRYGEEQRCT